MLSKTRMITHEWDVWLKIGLMRFQKLLLDAEQRLYDGHVLFNSFKVDSFVEHLLNSCLPEIERCDFLFSHCPCTLFILTWVTQEHVWYAPDSLCKTRVKW
jgi:hypothetical protein